jgi:predicted MPP superfamily phosphohydrolase
MPLRILIAIAVALVVIVAIDFYAYQAVRTVTASLSPRWRSIWSWAYWVFSVGVIVLLVVGVIVMGDRRATNHFAQYALGMVVLSVVPKLVIIVALLGEDAIRLFWAVWLRFTQSLTTSSTPPVQQADLLVSRSQFLSALALGAAAIPFAGIGYGLIRGRYQYTVHRQTLSFANLPPAFHGLRIVQLSDVHSGSFDSPADVARGIALAQAEKPDLIVFTGDLVNNTADEFNPWVEAFSKLRAPLGQFSILGNHDYGDYSQWPSEKAKAANLAHLEALHAQTGFRLLKNERVAIERDGQQFILAGVENWGLGFKQKGDLAATLNGLSPEQFILLLSHDPSHWDAEIRKHPARVELTLSGHTHGMQFGVEIPGFRWSPVKYRYPRWAGLYQEAYHRLYINRGFGFIGFPGRVGIWPEITVLTLERA